jgi:CubicO group peptidase (beta-lactamase class C family)
VLKSWKVVKQALTQYHQQQGLKHGASMSLVMDGKLYDALQLGYADREAQRKIDATQIHQWASISKTFTATAILQLAERGKLQLSDPITKYIPALATVKDPKGKSNFEEIKLHHLITHSAHFRASAIYDTVQAIKPNYEYENNYCFEDWMKYKHLFRFEGKPGEKYRYSNWGYSYLGMVIEKVSGMKFKDYVKKHIFEPLQMKDAFFSSPTTAGQRKRMAACYQVQADGKVKRRKPMHDQCFEEANGGLKATVNDIIKWMNFYSQTSTSKTERRRHAKVLKPTTVKKYFSVPDFSKSSKTFDADSLRLKSKNWMYTQFRVAGFYTNQVNSNQSVQMGHGGWQYNYLSRMFWHPKGNFGVIYTRNTEAFSNTPDKMFEVMFEYYYGELLEVTNKVIKN